MNSNILKHRIDPAEIDQLFLVEDAILNSLDRAQGVLTLLSFNFAHGVENQAASHICEKSIEAVLSELADIRAILKAHSAAKHQKPTQ